MMPGPFTSCALVFALLPAVLLAPVLHEQVAKPAEPAPPLPPMTMPVNRESDSYAIYSALMPLGETAGEGWPRGRFLIQDVTLTLAQSDQPCHSQGSRDGMDMNPHVAVHPAEEDQADFAEILNDFDLHCHERLRLSADQWKAAIAPVTLLTPAAQEEFRRTRHIPDAADAKKYIANPKWKDVPGLYGFSEVCLNAHHTVAPVYATHWCGGLCGEGFWVGLRLENGDWTQLQWGGNSWISQVPADLTQWYSL